jgi:hypothetical protein
LLDYIAAIFGGGVALAFPGYILPAFFSKSRTPALLAGLLGGIALPIALVVYGSSFDAGVIFAGAILGSLSGLCWYGVRKLSSAEQTTTTVSNSNPQ